MSHLSPDQLDAASKGEAFPHLTDCVECRQALHDAKARQKLLGGLTPYTLSDMAFRRVEARVMEAVTQPQTAWWPRALAWATGAVVLAAVAALVWPRTPVAPKPTPEVAVVVPRKLPTLPPMTVLAARDARVRKADGPWSELGPRSEVGGGATVTAARVELAATEALSPVLALSGSATFDDTLALGAGSLEAQVSQPMVVWAGPRRVEAASARFVVNRAAAETVVDVTDGDVELVDDAAFVRQTFHAPTRVRWADADRLPVVAPGTPAIAQAVLVPTRPWAWLDVSSLGSLRSLSLDGQTYEPIPSLFAVSEGRHRLVATTVAGINLDQWVTGLAGAPLSVEAPEKSDDRPPPADVISRLSAALQENKPKLAACYEQWLKANPTAEGEIVLALSVDAKGRVVSAKVDGAMPAQPKSCLVRTTRGLRLPAPGTPVDLELPLKLRAAGR